MKELEAESCTGTQRGTFASLYKDIPLRHYLMTHRTFTQEADVHVKCETLCAETKTVPESIYFIFSLKLTMHFFF